MGRKLFSADLINSFVVENFRPYAWSNLWEVTDPEEPIFLENIGKKIGLFYFRFCIRPNDYERKDLRSTNSSVLPAVEITTPYTITIPMLKGNSITKNNIELDKDAKVKWTYVQHLARNVIKTLDQMDTIAESRITSNKQVFGEEKSKETDGWSRVRSYENNDLRNEWTFFKENYYEDLIKTADLTTT